MRLTPTEHLALQFVEQTEGRVFGDDIGDALGMSERSGRRVLNSLVRKGYLQKTGRGKYVAAKRSVLAAKRPVLAVTKHTVSSSTTNEYVLVVDPNGSTPKEAAPRGETDQMPKPGRLSDDTSGDGWNEFDPDDNRKKPTKKPRGNYNAHRLVPREHWDTKHVVREFALRAHYAYPDRIHPSDNRTLLPALNEALAGTEYTPQMLASAVDAFFDSEDHRIPPNVTPNQAFLRYLNIYLASQRAEVTDDLITDLKSRSRRFS